MSDESSENLAKALQRVSTLWVHDASGDRAAWLNERLTLPWLMVRSCSPGWEQQWLERGQAAAVLWEVTSESYVTDLQSLVRLRRQAVPMMVIAALSEPLSELRVRVRGVGIADVLVGWTGIERLSQRLARWFQQHSDPGSDPWEWVARHLPGTYRP